MSNKRDVIFISGFEKNCGKTTFLNYLLSKKSYSDKIICASIGITSSQDDFLNSYYKPEVYVKKGWKIITNTLFFRYIDVPFTIENVIEENVGGGYPVVISPLYDCSIRLFSPGSNSKIFDVIDSISDLYDTVYIDGAFDRITQLSSFKNASFYYVFKVKPDNVDDVIDKIKMFESFIDIKVNLNNYDFMKNIDMDVVYHDILFVKGAFTYQKLENIPREVRKVIIMDFTKVFVNFTDWKSFKTKYEVYFSTSYKFLGYVVNLYDISRDEFEKRFEKKPLVKIIYNPYES